MYCKFNVWAGCLLFIFLSGCASRGDFNAVTNDYKRAQEQMSVHEGKIKELSLAFQESEKEKAQLNNQIKLLMKTIQEKETVISIQGKVITLLDDSEKTLQKSIEAQITAQNMPVTPSR